MIINVTLNDHLSNKGQLASLCRFERILWNIARILFIETQYNKKLHVKKSAFMYVTLLPV